MRSKDEILALLKEAVVRYDKKLAVSTATEAVRMGIGPAEAIEKGLGAGMAEISVMFNEGRMFLPQVLAASQAMSQAINIYERHMGEENIPSKGVVVIGTVEGDIHEIGKHVVSAFLRSAGFLVYDLGKDVPPHLFTQAAKELNASIVGASALMTTTLVGQRKIIERLKEERLFNVKTIFGGACCTSKWVENIGGDAYCECGSMVVQKVNALMM